MDLEWNDERTNKFISNVGLVTSKGDKGYNIMSCEWTHHISYSPSIIAICLAPKDFSREYITNTKEFGISICPAEENSLASIAGGNHGNKVDKIKVLEELGHEFYQAKNIDVLMLKGASMNAECKVIDIHDIGDHRMFVGEVIDIIGDPEKESLIYHGGKYYKLGEQLHRPEQEKMDEIAALIEKHTYKED